MRTHVEIYRDRASGWRFRFIAGNGRIIAQGESYLRKAACLKTVYKILALSPYTEVVEK